jgi:hypothetical protein
MLSLSLYKAPHRSAATAGRQRVRNPAALHAVRRVSVFRLDFRRGCGLHGAVVTSPRARGVTSESIKLGFWGGEIGMHVHNRSLSARSKEQGGRRQWQWQ